MLFLFVFEAFHPGTKYMIEFSVRAGAGWVGELLDRDRGGHRCFATLDAAAVALYSVGFVGFEVVTNQRRIRGD